MTDIAADVISIVAKRVQPVRHDLALTDRIDELGIDSMSAVEMIFDLEEKFDIQIPYNSNDTEFELKTIGEIVDAIKDLLRGKS